MSTGAAHPAENRLILLRISLDGATFGLDAEQVAAIKPLREGEAAADLLWLHQALGYRGPVAYRQPMALHLKESGRPDWRPFRLVVEAPEDLREVGWRQVRPLPLLLEPFTRPRGLWGVLPLAGKLILLLDVHRLSVGGPAHEEEMHL